MTGVYLSDMHQRIYRRTIFKDKGDVSMAIVSDEIMEKIKRFLDMISDSGLHLERVILFGSYAKGTASKWSDIDITLVSRDFTGVGFYDRKRIKGVLRG
jgi:predicted nucleotidyltransferase